MMPEYRVYCGNCGFHCEGFFEAEDPASALEQADEAYRDGLAFCEEHEEFGVELVQEDYVNDEP